MRLSGGKAQANENKYPHIVAVSVAGRGLEIELNRQIVNFHKARHIQPRHGRHVAGARGQTHYRWCFSDLETAQSFAKQFSGKIIRDGLS